MMAKTCCLKILVQNMVRVSKINCARFFAKWLLVIIVHGRVGVLILKMGG